MFLRIHPNVLIKECTATIEVNAGIAQGTVLGPLLFIFYMNDIFSIVHRSRLTLFADDCVIYFSANIWNNISDILQLDLNNVSSWLLDNGLRLNTAKTKALIIGSQSKLNSIKDPTLFMSNIIRRGKGVTGFPRRLENRENRENDDGQGKVREKSGSKQKCPKVRKFWEKSGKFCRCEQNH